MKQTTSSKKRARGNWQLGRARKVRCTEKRKKERSAANAQATGRSIQDKQPQTKRSKKCPNYRHEHAEKNNKKGQKGSMGAKETGCPAGSFLVTGGWAQSDVPCDKQWLTAGNRDL